MIDLLWKHPHDKESKVQYVPTLKEIDKEVRGLIEKPILDRSFQTRLISLTGTSANSKFYVTKSEEYGGAVFIMAPDRTEPILRISVGENSHALMGTNKLGDKLTVWDLEDQNIENQKELGHMVKKIILGDAKVTVYDLSKDAKVKMAGKQDKVDFGFTRRTG
ncbi:MAG TPA: hypothetical protein VKC53_00185 [Patescibacteria group bacterium]|nr:hypothetical protein [Patescibacteria group bacterium]